MFVAVEGAGADEAVEGVKEGVSEGDEIEDGAEEGGEPDSGGAYFGDAILADGEFEERGPIEIGVGGDEALGDESDSFFGERLHAVGEDVVIGEGALPEIGEAVVEEILATDGHGAAPGEVSAERSEECGDLGVEDGDDLIGAVGGDGNVITVAGGGTHEGAVHKGSDQTAQPVADGFGVGIHEDEDFIRGGGAFDGGELVVNFLATGFGESGDDDFDPAVFDGYFFEKRDDGVVVGFDGEDDAIVGVVLLEEEPHVFAGVIIHALDGNDDHGGSKPHIGELTFGEPGQAQAETLREIEGPDGEDHRHAPDEEHEEGQIH